jgi:hypothetical protein
MNLLYLYVLSILASTSLYGMYPIESDCDLPTYSEIESNTTPEQQGIVNYSECTINETTGEAYGIEYTNDGINETTSLYHVYGNDHNPEPDTSSEVTSERDNSGDIPDSRVETLGDAMARDLECAERWRREESSEEEGVEKLPTRKNTVVKIYTTTPCSSTMRQNLASPEVRAGLQRIKQELESKTWKSSHVHKKIAFITMALDGSLVEKIKLVEEGDRAAAQAIYQELRDAWPWVHKVSFMERFADGHERAFIGALGGTDVVNEVERALIARPDYQKAQGIDLSSFFEQCRQKQMRGDFEGLAREHTELCGELLSKNAPQNTLHLRCRIVTLRLFMVDPVTTIFNTIATHIPEMARKQVMDLTRQLGEFYSKNGIQPLSEMAADMVERYGHDLITRARICYELRPDYKPELGAVSSISWEIIITNIVQGPLPVAQRELDYLEQQIQEHCAANNITPEQQKDYLIKEVGFDLVGCARGALKLRTDYQPEPDGPPLATPDLPATGGQTTANMPTATSSSSAPVTDANASGLTARSTTPHVTSEAPAAGANTSSASSNTPNIVHIDIQQQIIQSLLQGQDRGSLAKNLRLLTHEVITQKSVYNTVAFPDIGNSIERSIETIKTTGDAREFAFHMARVDHVLYDVQNQTNTTPTLLQRSPELLTRAIRQYWKNLAPTETEISFVCDLARYVSDVTIGTHYLSPEVREQRVQTFWKTVDTLSSLRLSDMTWENSVDASMYVAARATWLLGLGQAATVVGNIKNGCALSPTAASFSSKFLGALEGIIAGSPIIGADGTAIGTISSALAADVVKVVAVAAAIEQVKEPPTLFNAQDKEPQKMTRNLRHRARNRSLISRKRVVPIGARCQIKGC